MVKLLEDISTIIKKINKKKFGSKFTGTLIGELLLLFQWISTDKQNNGTSIFMAKLG